MENGDDSKYDDIELFFWETNDDDDDTNTNNNTNNSNNNNNDRNKYDFTFDSDDGDAILKEGELSDEEIRLKELYANGLASYKKSSSSSSSSVTFGLDDIYDDNYGKEKTKRKKSNDNDWFGTYSNKKNVLDGIIDKGSMVRGGRAEKYLADRSKKHPLSTPELEAADGWSDEGLEEYDGLKDQ
jgi:hypothetical protein